MLLVCEKNTAQTHKDQNKIHKEKSRTHAPEDQTQGPAVQPINPPWHDLSKITKKLNKSLLSL